MRFTWLHIFASISSAENKLPWNVSFLSIDAINRHYSSSRVHVAGEANK